MQMFIVRTIVAALVIGIVSQISNRYPRIGAVLLTLPVVSILAFLMTDSLLTMLKECERLSQ